MSRHKLEISSGGWEHPTTARFYGGDDADVNKITFMFENVTTRGKENEERDMEFICHLEGVELHFYYETFERDGLVPDDAKSNQMVKREFKDRY